MRKKDDARQDVGMAVHLHNEMVMKKIGEGGNKSGLYDHLKMIITKEMKRLQKTQPTRGGAVTVVWQTMCKLCLPPSRPKQWVPDYRVFGKPAMRTRWMADNAPQKSERCRD